MKQRMRITIEVDTSLARSSFNAVALTVANNAADVAGTLVYCGTEVVTEKRINLYKNGTVKKRVKSS